ncbi:MAG: hypothetical protein B7Y74_07740, partial [Novosphingobium sp. 35-62-5]
MDEQTQQPEPQTVTPAEPAPKARTLGPLRMIWDEAARYPGRVAAASAALVVTSAATLAIPSGFRLIIDKGFSAGADVNELGRWFQYLLLIVLVLAIGTACRFYFVSWLGERVVADVRLKVQANLLRLPPSFFETNSPKEIASRMTSDTAVIEQVVGTTVSVALRNTITAIGGLIALWGFHADTPQSRVPEAAAIAGWVNQRPRMADLHIENNTVWSSNPAVQLDLGGYAKGHALDDAAAIL